jgi:hypothetical protein
MSDQNPPQCIYCKKATVQLNREHVIPEAFGSYGSETMVLSNNAVCADCNSRLGAEIDQILNRDSYEALIRANSMDRGHGHTERFAPRRFSIFVPDEEAFGILRGARMTIDWNSRRPKLLDQIIVRDRNQALHTFLAEEFPNTANAIFQDLPRGAIRVVGTSTANVEALMQMVRERGIRLRQRESLLPPDAISQPDIPVVIEGRIDTKTWRAFEGHLVAYQTEGRSLRGKVSLYNSITYDVMLCADLGLYYRLNNGHAFDPIDHQVIRLRNLPFHVLQPAEAACLLFRFS